MVDERYKLLSKLGSGRFGEVHLASDMIEQRLVILKELIDLDSPQNLENFLTEIETLIALKRFEGSECIPSLLSFDIGPKTGAYYTMGLAGISNLFDLSESSGVESLDSIRFLFRQLVQSIQYLHSIGFAHLDIKPENILITDGGKVVLCDFGSARRVNSSKETFIYGSECYMAPEALQANELSSQGKGFRNFDLRRMDSFGLGVVLFVLVFKSIPFQVASKEDPYFRRLMTNPPSFWKIFSGIRTIPENLRSLLQELLTAPAETRLLPAEIIEHEWLNEPDEDPKFFAGYFSELRLSLLRISNKILDCIDYQKKNPKVDHAKQKALNLGEETLRRFVRLRESKILHLKRRITKRENSNSDSLSGDSTN